MSAKRKPIERLSADEVANLKNAEFYPASVYAGAFGLKTLAAVVRDYDAGIIDDKECRITGSGVWKGRGRGRKLRIEIRGREIKRCALREGRVPKHLAGRV